MEYERIIGDPVPDTGCDEEDFFEDDGITDFQLLHTIIQPRNIILKVRTNPQKWLNPTL